MSRFLLVILGLILFLAIAGCSAITSPPRRPAPPPPSPVAPAEEPDFSFLTGTWSMTTELTSIDNPVMAAAAEQPTDTWACVVTGDTMVLVTDRREYSGTLAPEAESGWVYEAKAAFTDEDGYTWTSAIEVHGKPTSLDFGSFAGGMTDSIETADEGHLYTATWDILGTRQ